MNSSQEACLYLKKLKQLLEYADISDCNMEEGSLRCDANVSVRRRGETALGTKTEIKNVNSIKFIQKAIDYEIDRQVALLEEGGRVVQETRLFDSNSGKTRPMRSKEEAHDYRYFPEPDLVPVELSEEQIERIRAELPEKPDRMQQRFQEQYALPAYDALVLTADRFLAAYFERCLEIHANPKLVSNWIMGELIRELNAGNTTADRFPVSPEEFAGLLRMVDTGTISGNIAKSVFAKMIETGDSAATIVEREGLSMISDKSELDQLVRDVLDSNPSTVSDFKNGKKKALGFLVGQVMKASRGKADPRMVNTLLKKALT
jgi:aspartyl-tRNA(Asn)/glutamyl-tRNA(Gln) amidotransferase subunit B